MFSRIEAEYWPDGAKAPTAVGRMENITTVAAPESMGTLLHEVTEEQGALRGLSALAAVACQPLGTVTETV